MHALLEEMPVEKDQRRKHVDCQHMTVGERLFVILLLTIFPSIKFWDSLYDIK